MARDAGRTVIDLDDPAAFVLYTGRHAYAHEDGTCVVPLDVLWAGERFGKR